MAKRILVALDRENPPSALLDLIVNAAAGGGATVRLLHVAPMPQDLRDDADDRVIAYVDEEAARVQAEMLDELRTVELWFGWMPVDSVVRFGDPVREILAEAEAFDADLIAMPIRCHRRATRRFGSVAEEVGRRAPMAVAMVRAAE